MVTEIICAGFGGQGVLTAGMIIAGAGHKSGMRITWYPSYGMEMRGGTANCNVKLSDTEIGSPYCDNPDIVIAMNEPSVSRFEAGVKPGGYLFVNENMLDGQRSYRNDINVVLVPANELAEKANNLKGANLVMLGAVVRTAGILEKEPLANYLRVYFEEKGKGKYNESNIAAFYSGYEAVSGEATGAWI